MSPSRYDRRKIYVIKSVQELLDRPPPRLRGVVPPPWRGFRKKIQKTPAATIRLAKRRLRNWERRGGQRSRSRYLSLS
jgi:hypothetical protein